MQQTLPEESQVSRNEQLLKLPRTPTEAKLLGTTLYYTTFPCKHGHYADRNISDRKCKECLRIKGQKRDQRRETLHTVRRKWIEANREKIREYDKQYAKLNPLKIKTQVHNRRSLKRNAEGFHTEKDLGKLFQTQTCCQECSRVFNLDNPATLDHIIALANGGSNWPSNLQLLCKPCNSSKGSRR